MQSYLYCTLCLKQMLFFYFIAIPSEDEIKHFLEAAGANDLVVVPLVQTFGHLEVLVIILNYTILVCSVKVLGRMIHVLYIKD